MKSKAWVPAIGETIWWVSDDPICGTYKVVKVEGSVVTVSRDGKTYEARWLDIGRINDHGIGENDEHFDELMELVEQGLFPLSGWSK